MKKKKIKIQSADEVVVFSDNASTETSRLEERTEPSEEVTQKQLKAEVYKPVRQEKEDRSRGFAIIDEESEKTDKEPEKDKKAKKNKEKRSRKNKGKKNRINSEPETELIGENGPEIVEAEETAELEPEQEEKEQNEQTEAQEQAIEPEQTDVVVFDVESEEINEELEEEKKSRRAKGKRSFKLGNKRKKRNIEPEPAVFENEEYTIEFEQSEGTVIDIEASDEQQEPELDSEAALMQQEPLKSELPEFNPEEPVEYSKAVDSLPVAQASEDVYADIVKNIDEELHFERTSRQAKYEREQYFVSSENPFQRNRENQEQGEEELSYEDINRKELKTFDEMFASAKAKVLPQKGEKKSEQIRKIVSNASVFVLICCAIAFALIFVQSKRAEKQQLGLSSQIVDISSAEEEEQLWEEFKAKYPNIKTPDGMMAKYAYLYAINQQLAGWVSIPNSGVDVQVVQAADNKTYLKKDFYGNYSRYGCPFLDYRNDAKYLNQNTIIYGHHMSDGLIFAELSKYKELSGFLESPIICFDTLYKTYYFKVYAAFITNTREQDDNGYIFNYTVTDFASPQSFDGYIAALDERKLYTTGVDINSGDKLITLSTCTYEFNDARLVIIGRMLRTGETVDIDTTYATKNGNPHYPQVWYDKNGKSNPFAGAERWYPEG